MREYFILNGVDSRDFGVYISGQGTFSAPQKAYTFYNIPGRNGALLGNEHRLENINVSYEAFIYTDFDNQLAAFRSFLLSIDGYAKLSDSYHPDEYRYAVYQGPFEPTVEKTNDAGKFTIIFSCKPQRYLLSGDASYYWVPGGSQELSGSGIAGSIESVVLSHLQAMTLTLNFRTTTQAAMSLVAPVPHLIELRVAQQSLDEVNGTINVSPVRHVFVVVPKSYRAGSVAPATNADASGDYAVRYWKTIVNGRVMTELDPLHFICTISGADFAEPVRAALGKQ